MIDKQAILERVDLLTLAVGDLKRVASTNGGEWAGACPFCGGRDRFRVQPNAKPYGLWMCRGCTDGKWQNAIDFVIARDACDFKAACATLAGGKLPTTREWRTAPETPAYAPPGEEWQAAALRAVNLCYDNLWHAPGAAALAYLRGRGLAEDVIHYYSLGYSPGFKMGDLQIRKGIVIPCLVRGSPWYLKICYLPGQRVWCHGSDRDKPHFCEARKKCPNCGEVNKYTHVSGGKASAIFGAGNLVDATLGVIVEGEFDAMILDQEISNPMVGVATFGSAGNRPDLATWGAYFLGIRHIIGIYDNDERGQQGAAKLAEMSERVRIVQLPRCEGVKDINDYYLKNMPLGSLHEWVWDLFAEMEHPDSRPAAVVSPAAVGAEVG